MGMLTGKVALVTGASRGLGRAVAEAFSREGASLAICARGAGALAEAAAALRSGGGRVLALQADASEPRDVERLVSTTLGEYGQIDVLVNNAGILGPSPMPYLIDLPATDLADVLRVNTVGPFLVTRIVLAHMLQRGEGSIINVTSSAGAEAYAGWGAYSVSKFALEGMSRVWAEELAGTGVRLNLVDPGEMDTAMHALAVPDCDYGLARPEQVTGLFLYLASDQSRHLHGERLEAQEYADGR